MGKTGQGTGRAAQPGLVSFPHAGPVWLPWPHNAPDEECDETGAYYTTCCICGTANPARRRSHRHGRVNLARIDVGYVWYS